MKKITKETKLNSRTETILLHCDGKVLDIGCKECKLVIKGTLLGLDITGVDISRDYLAEGNFLARESGIEIKTVRNSIYTLDEIFEPKTFDTVIIGELIEHLENIEKGIFSAWRLVKPGGKLIITTPCGFGHYDQDHKNFFFTQESLDIINKHWMFDMCSKLFIDTAKVYLIENVLNRIPNSKSEVKEIEWGDSKHPSLDFFINIKKVKSE